MSAQLQAFELGEITFCTYAEEERARFVAWCLDEWTRARWGLSEYRVYETSEAAPAGAHILDFKHARKVYRAYKVALYEEGSKSGAISKMVLHAIPWACAVAIVFLVVLMAVNK